MLERYVYIDPITPIHGQTYNVNQFIPLANSQHSSQIYIIPPLINDFENIKDCLTLSNHRVFMKKYSHLDGVFNLNCNGSVGVAIRLYLVLTNAEMVYDLQSDIAIDENDLKNMFKEWEQKEISKMVNEIKPLINLEKYLPNFKEIVKTYNHNDLSSLIKRAVLELGLEWSYNDDPAEQITPDYILPFIEDMIIIDHCSDYSSIINKRSWYCSYTEDLFFNKFQKHNSLSSF
jgi:hypothetical protein